LNREQARSHTVTDLSFFRLDPCSKTGKNQPIPYSLIRHKTDSI
jgi:pyrimidine deaminase RibD-like protein